MDDLVKRYLAMLAITPTTPSLDLVNQIVKKHIATFSFSSANVLLNKSLSLEPDALFERVIFNRTGGYCFEHNKIMHWVLEQLGFSVKPLMTRVLLIGEEGMGRLHRVTLLEFNNEHYIVDVGFGVLTAPSLFALKTHKVTHASGVYEMHQTDENQFRLNYLPHNGDKQLTLYRFDLAEFTEMDCDIGHFYSSHSPDAAFVNNLVISQVHESERIVIRNRMVTFYCDKHNTKEEQSITSSEQLHSLLTDFLNLSITQSEAKFLFEFTENK